jgi:tetratricopeptide (TPR) repeat protein
VTRDNVIYTSCGFLLGLVLGGLVIGPKIAESKAASAAAPAITAAAPAAASTATGGNPMAEVAQRLAALKAAVERDPRDAAALAQLGNLYMDAAKFPQAIDYYERALAVRDDPSIRTDLGICYKQSGQLEKALEQFRRAGAASPDQWQALYNEAIVLGELHRMDEARAVVAKLKAIRPNDAEVQRLSDALAKTR